MQQIIKPVLSADDLSAGKMKENMDEKSVSELGYIQSDRSFLPKSSEQPVHKCGCT